MAKIYKIISVSSLVALMLILPFRRSIPFDPYGVILLLFILAVGFLWLALNKDEKNGIEKKVVILGLDLRVVGVLYGLNLLVSEVRSDLGDLQIASMAACLAFCRILIWDKAENRPIPYELKKDQLFAVKSMRFIICMYILITLISLAEMPVIF
jgi:hypothetical protein